MNTEKMKQCEWIYGDASGTSGSFVDAMIPVGRCKSVSPPCELIPCRSCGINVCNGCRYVSDDYSILGIEVEYLCPNAECMVQADKDGLLFSQCPFCFRDLMDCGDNSPECKAKWDDMWAKEEEE